MVRGCPSSHLGLLRVFWETFTSPATESKGVPVPTWDYYACFGRPSHHQPQRARVSQFPPGITTRVLGDLHITSHREQGCPSSHLGLLRVFWETFTSPATESKGVPVPTWDYYACFGRPSHHQPQRARVSQFPPGITTRVLGDLHITSHREQGFENLHNKLFFLWILGEEGHDRFLYCRTPHGVRVFIL